MDKKIITFLFVCLCLMSNICSYDLPNYLFECEITLKKDNNRFCNLTMYNTIDCFPWDVKKCNFVLLVLSPCPFFKCEV